MLVEHFADKGITKVVGTEARGFLFGAPVALRLGVGFVPVRKKGKLPCDTSARPMIWNTALIPWRCIKTASAAVTTCWLSMTCHTGGTVNATIRLIRRLGGEVHEAAFIIGLPDLGGAERLEAEGVHSFCLLEYAGG